MSVIRTRIGLGTVLVALVTLLFYADRAWFPGIPSTLVIALIALGAQAEFYLMLRDAGQQPRVVLGLAAGGAWLAAVARDYPREHLLALCTGVALVLGVLEGRTRRAPQRIGVTLLAVLAIPVLLAYLMEIRAMEYGWAWLIFVVAVAKTGDSAAFFIGSAFGRRRLAPKVSPNKSWEGAAASVAAGAIAGGVVAHTAFAFAPPWTIWLPAALVTNVGAQFGDLCESLLKRGCSSKDSASLLPAFGGMFDLVDSFLVAAPALYAYLVFFT